MGRTRITSTSITPTTLGQINSRRGYCHDTLGFLCCSSLKEMLLAFSTMKILSLNAQIVSDRLGVDQRKFNLRIR